MQYTTVTATNVLYLQQCNTTTASGQIYIILLYTQYNKQVCKKLTYQNLAKAYVSPRDYQSMLECNNQSIA